jgi:plasmid maintenance system antidote protein VapI
MPILREQSFLTEILEGQPIPVGKLEYFRARLRSRLHQIVVGEWLRRESLSQADLARRIGKKPEVVNRLLGAPGNWTLDTVSDLLLGMGTEPLVSVQLLEEIASRSQQWGDSENTVSPETLEQMPVGQDAAA